MKNEIYEILAPFAIFGVGIVFIKYFANFPEYSFLFPMLALFLTLCSVYAYFFLSKELKKDKNNVHMKNIWAILTMAIGSAVVLGLVNEWSDKICDLFGGYYGLSLLIAVMGGGAFFALLLNKSTELFGVFQSTEDLKVTIFKFVTFAVSLSFWFVLLTSYYNVPWYVHLILLLSSISLSFSLEYFKYFKDFKKESEFKLTGGGGCFLRH